MTSTSLSDSNFITEVRNALAGLDAQKIPDATIKQTRDRLVEPLLDDLTDSPNQTLFDNAVIFMTAEYSFGAWMTFTRLRDREIESYVDPNTYQKNLETRTNQALGNVGVTRPPEIPNTVVSVAHDGVNRRVQLDKVWVTEE